MFAVTNSTIKLWSRVFSVIAFTSLAVACAHGESYTTYKEKPDKLVCKGGSTPVAGKNGQPIGCTPAPLNILEPGMSCEDFPPGSVTVDRTGATYVCE